MEIIQYLIIIVVAVVIAVAIIKSRDKNFKVEVNKLVYYLGGRTNIINYDFNKSRFTVELNDITKVKKEAIQKLGAQGIVEIDNQLKIIIGEGAKQLKKQIDNLMKS